MPSDFGHILRDHLAETDHHVPIGSRLGDQVPGVAQESLDGKSAWNLVTIVEQFDFGDPAEVEGARGPVQRRPAGHVPTPPAEKQLVGIEFCADFLAFVEAAVSQAHAVPLGNGLEQLIVDRAFALQGIFGQWLDVQGVDHFAELIAQPAGQGAFQFHRGAAGRIEKRQSRRGRPFRDKARSAPRLLQA